MNLVQGMIYNKLFKSQIYMLSNDDFVKISNIFVVSNKKTSKSDIFGLPNLLHPPPWQF